MRRLTPSLARLVGLLLLVSSQFAPFAMAAKTQPKPGERNSPIQYQALDPAGIERLKADSGGDALVAISRATGGARFVRLIPGSREDLMKSSVQGKKASAQEKSSSFLKEYGSIFGLRNASAELSLKRENNDSQGGKHLSYEQVYRGVPVFAGTLKTHFDREGRLTSVNGNIVPRISLDPNPSVTARQAGAAALAKVAGDLGASEGLSVHGTTLYVYRTGLAQGVDGKNHLTWEVEVGNKANVRELVYIDAHSGKFVDQVTGIHDALNRRAYDGRHLPGVPPEYPHDPVWVEGDPLPTGNTELDNMLLASADTYYFFFNAFGRDSFDGAGGTMDQIFNRGYSCPNASWNGTFISFCPGLTTDDVTAHEWGHAYTQYTHGLIYQWQPGALNEAYSDIFGETIDLINGRGLDAPNGHRSDDPTVCSAYQPFSPKLTIHSPPTIAGDYPGSPAQFGPAITGPTTGEVVLAMDPADPTGPSTTDACSPITTDLTGKIALVDRGACGFAIKVKNAQDRGAIAVLVANNQGGTVTNTMGGADPTIVIPSMMITQNAGTAIKAELAMGNVVTATLQPNAPPNADQSVRWLLGEEDTAQGLTGALRDMWNPNCLGQPGKVSDPQYVCSTADQGGVHTNSGVPNHAYALLVDGGTYNGQTINAIGLTKAAHIYYRAMTVYQHPASDFADHADAIEQSAADLVGVNLNDLVTGQPSGQSITADDIVQVQKAMLAVEMRTPPTFCNFQPLLGQNPPADPACDAATVRRVLFADDFEGDTSQWTVSREVTSPTFTPRDWTVSSALPDNRPGKAFFAPDPDTGDCTNVNETGVLNLTSPVITVSSAVASGPTLTFEHWVATESRFDGGQLLISVNGGPFTLVPAANFIYNGYNTTLLPPAGNTNPRAGQPAWSGTDAGAVDGTWGKSIVNLAGLVGAGNTIQLRWDLSTDCASGRFGWYVDNVVFYDCEPDSDGDGVADGADECPGTNLTQTIVIVGTGRYSNTGVPNTLLPTGCTLQQKIDECAANNTNNHGSFVSCVSDLTNQWVAEGIITDAQKGAIMRAAAQAR